MRFESVLLKIFRLFASFRHTEAELARESSRAIELQTRLAEMGSQNLWLREELKSAQERERRATQTMANFGFQLKFGNMTVPFPEAQTIQPDTVSPAELDPPPPGSVLASALMAAKSRDILSQLDRYTRSDG
ncbi:MAG: hypothetical protein QM757_26445 [Paludibaculum sp.]